MTPRIARWRRRRGRRCRGASCCHKVSARQRLAKRILPNKGSVVPLRNRPAHTLKLHPRCRLLKHEQPISMVPCPCWRPWLMICGKCVSFARFPTHVAVQQCTSWDVDNEPVSDGRVARSRVAGGIRIDHHDNITLGCICRRQLDVRGGGEGRVGFQHLLPARNQAQRLAKCN